MCEEIICYTTIEEVANYFLSKKSMSSKKLIRLCYYAYAWTLSLLNESINELNYKLFDDKFEAWVHGCVNPKLFYKYKDYGWEDIPKINNYQRIFDTDVLEILEDVWNTYGELSSEDLEICNRQELPRIDARQGCKISDACNNYLDDQVIYLYYNRELVRNQIQ